MLSTPAPGPRSSAFGALAHWHAPGLCRVCRSWCPGAICAPCGATCSPRVGRCSQCALPLEGAARCGECLRDPPPFTQTLCLADYGFPWSGLIAAFKFRSQPELAGLFAAALLERARAEQRPSPDLFIPVPLTRRRLAERGYNQAWELARRLARGSGAAGAAQALERRFDHHAPQAELTRAERLAALRGAFAVAPRKAPPLRDRFVALVDDVMTTGGTARAAAGVLLGAGAARVDLWVVARTPAD